MKKPLLILLFLILVISSISCTPRRDFSDANIVSIATEDYEFDQLYFFRILDSETIQYLTGSPANNTGVGFGNKDGQEVMIWISRNADVMPIVLDYPLEHSIPQIAAAVFSLQDEFGAFLYDMPHDYGAIEISVSFAQLLSEHIASLTLDSDLVFHFYTDTRSFYCVESGGVLQIYNESFELLNEE